MPTAAPLNSPQFTASGSGPSSHPPPPLPQIKKMCRLAVLLMYDRDVIRGLVGGPALTINLLFLVKVRSSSRHPPDMGRERKTMG